MKEDKHGAIVSASLTIDFGGQPLTVHTFRGRPCVIAADVGRVLGYADDGKRLVDRLRSDWFDELIPARDIDTLRGDDLREFKDATRLTPESGVSGNVPSLTILYESGVDLVCIKTDKPLGKKLRRFLADEVLPKLRRGEAISARPISADRTLDIRKAELLAEFARPWRRCPHGRARQDVLAASASGQVVPPDGDRRDARRDRGACRKDHHIARAARQFGTLQDHHGHEGERDWAGGLPCMTRQRST